MYFTVKGIIDRNNLVNATSRINIIYQDFGLINQ